MLEKFVANVLTTYLGKFVDNLDKKHLKVSIWNGSVVLDNLKLKKNALRSLELPISIKDSNIGKLKIFIPWTRLRSESVRVEIEDVVVTVHPKKAAKYDQQEEEDDFYEAKLEELDVFEGLRRDREQQQAAAAAAAAAQEDGGEASPNAASSPTSSGGQKSLNQLDDELAQAETEAKDASFVQRLKGTMVKNIQVQLKNVEVQYEDIVTDPKRPIMMAFHFESFTAHSTDKGWQPHFAGNKEVFLYKLLQLSKLSIAVATNHQPATTATAIKDNNKDDDDEPHVIESLFTSSKSKEVICNPVSIEFRLQHQPIPIHQDAPRWKADVIVSDTHITITRKQWDSIWRSIRYVQRFDQIDAFRRYRPSDVSPVEDPKAWWRYAINSVRHVVRKRRTKGKFYWQDYVEMKKQQNEYMELHKRKQGGEWLMPLTDREDCKYEEFQRELPIDVLKRSRSLAYARHALEAEQHEAREQYIARRDAKSKKANGWFGWWSGKAGPEEEEENPEDEEEVARLWGIIDSDRWSDEQRKVLAEEFGMDLDDTTDAVHTPQSLSRNSKTVYVSLSFKKGYLELVDYRKTPFVEMVYTDLNVTYRATEDTYQFGMELRDFNVCEVLNRGSPTAAASPASPFAIGGRHNSSEGGRFGSGGEVDPSAVIVGVATGRLQQPGQPAMRFQYQKLDEQEGGGVMFRVLGEVCPLDVSLNVPTLQKIVSFWGVDTSLVDEDTAASDATSQAAQNAAIRRQEAMPLVTQLSMWYDRQQVTQVQIQMVDLRLTIPDVVKDLSSPRTCRFSIQMLSIVNDVESLLEAKAKLAAGNTQDIVPEDWVETYQVQLGALAVDAFFETDSRGEVQSRVVEEIDGVMIIRKSVVRANYDVPMFGVEFQIDHSLRLESDRDGFFVMFSAISLLTDFINNMSGRGTLHIDKSEDDGGQVSSTADSFISTVYGPFPSYTVHDVDERTDAMKMLLPPYATATRFCEVTRGFITLYHETRQSMPFAKLQIRPDEFTIDRTGRQLRVYVHQGGEDHAVRSGLKEAHALFAACEVPLIPSIPQQGAAVAIAIENRKKRAEAEPTCGVEPFSEATESRLWAAFDVIKQSANTNPCTCCMFDMEDEAQAIKLEKVIRQNAAVEELPVPTIQGEISSARKLQKMFDLRCTCPSLLFLIEDGDCEVSMNFCDSVSIEFSLTLFTRTVHMSSDGVLICENSCSSPLWNTPKVSEDGEYSSFNLTFVSSWLPKTTPSLTIDIGPKTTVVFNTPCVRANELLWDLIGIFMMRHLTWSYHIASPWRKPGDGNKGSTFNEAAKHKTMLLDLKFDAGVEMLMQYDDEKATDALRIAGSKLDIRWTMSDAANITDVFLEHPQLDLIYPNAPGGYKTFVSPKLNSPETPSMLFSYKVLYKPFDMPNQEWMLQSGGSGFNHTHYLTMNVRHCLGAYWQPGLWSMLEFFTNGHMIRLGYMGWRPKYTLESVPPHWPFELPPGMFNFALLHQDIELVDCDACLPFNAEEAPWLWVELPRMSMFSELEHNLPESDDDEIKFKRSTDAEVRMGSRMTFANMTCYAIKDEAKEDYKSVSKSYKYNPHEPIPVRPEDLTIAVMDNFTMDFNIWFEAASLLKTHSEKTMEIDMMDGMIFRGSTDQFCYVMEWISRGLMEPWKSWYEPKVWPDKPFPRMIPDDTPICFYDWIIKAERACFHLNDGARFHLPQRGNVYCGKEPQTILDVHGLDVSLKWYDDLSFASVTKFVSGFGWDLSHTQLKTCTTIFVDDPREIVTSKRKVLRVFPDSAKGDEFGAIINYGWTKDGPEKEVYGEYNFSVLELDLIPRYIVNLRDTLLSLRVRNGIAPILKWPQYVVGVGYVPPAPWDPKTQQWEVRQEMFAKTLVLTLFEDPDAIRPVPIFQTALAGFRFKNVSAREAVSSEMTILLDTIASNGIVCDDGGHIKPVIVPQSKKQNVTDRLLTLKKHSDTGMTGTVGCVWVFNPEQSKIKMLREALQHKSIEDLQWAWEYQEERQTRMEEYYENPPPKKKPSEADDMHFTILNPCLVINEHNNTKRGIVVNFGKLTFGQHLVKETVDQRMKVVMNRASITSLHSQGEYLLTPTNGIVEGIWREDGVSEFRAHMDAILIDIAQEYYESVLHSAVRHLVLDEAALVERKDEKIKQRTQSQIAAEEETDLDSLSPDRRLERRKAEAKRKAAEGRQKVQKIKAVIDWDRLQTRIHSDSVAIVLNTGHVHVDYAAEAEDYMKASVIIGGVRLGVEGRKPLFSITGATDEEYSHGGKDRKASDQSPTPTPADLEAQFNNTINTTGTLTPEDSPYSRSAQQSPTPTSSTPPVQTENRKIHVDVVQNVGNQDISGTLGTCTLYLDHETVVPAISFLYEPYRRIVLPSYGVSEVITIDDNMKLDGRLVLSSRKILRISSAKVNHITIDCQGHEIYFLDAAKPIVVIESGMTVEIICGKIHLYDHPLEHYFVAGNGSYIVVQESRNAVLRTDHLLQANSALSPSPSRGNLEDGMLADPSSPGAQPNPDYRKSIRVATQISVILPEGHVKASSAPASSTPSGAGSSGALRALTLRMDLGIEHTAKMEFGDFSESGTFDVDNLQADCVYVQDEEESHAGGGGGSSKATSGVTQTKLNDFSSLISPWSMTVGIEGSAKAEEPSNLKRTLSISSQSGVDVRFRYGDFQLVMHALDHSKKSLSHIENEVLGHDVSSEDPVVSKSGGGEGSLKIVTSLPRIGFFVVDDSSGLVDFPLLYVSLSDITTPTLELLSHTTLADISLALKIEYYNLRVGGWDTLLSKLQLRFAAKDVKNVTLEDIQRRRGSLKAGLYCDEVKLHLTPMAAHTVTRINTLLAKLQNPADATVPATTVTVKKNSNNNRGLRSSTQNAASEEFFTYNVSQQVGSDMTIGFAENDEPRFPKARKLDVNEVFAFNFPRINGREIPISQHFITINGREVVNVAKVGLAAVGMLHGANVTPIVADVQLQGGQKVVVLRTNVTFTNNLTYPICVAGVGDVLPESKLNVPLESMRKRCTFCPKVAERCHDASLGIPFNNLPSLHDQQFLCTSELDEPGKAQKAFFYMLSLGPQVALSNRSQGQSTQLPPLQDISATFEAPFSIINNSGVSLQVGLLHRYLKQNHKKGKLMTALTGDSEFYFNQITTITIATEETYPVTEVDPMQNVYADVVLSQPTGELMARVGGDKSSKRPPALIRSRHKGSRDQWIHVCDQNGQALLLRLEYSDRNVIISCPFWIINQTQHYLQITDGNPKKKNHLSGGLTEDGLAPVTTPFLVCTERMIKNSSKCHLYVRIGRHTTTGEMSWTQWSSACKIDNITDIAICNCGNTADRSVSISYSVQFVGGAIKDTRVIKFTPRWIVINRCPRPISVWQQIADSDHTTLPQGHSHMLEKAMIEASNDLRVAYCEDEEISHCEWSDTFSIDKFSEKLLNLHYLKRSDPQKRQFSVVRISCYTRASILYISVDLCDSPPYLVENRTNCVVYCRQQKSESTSALTVYPRCTNGFVWENASAPPTLLLWAAERDSQQVASRSILISLDPATLTKRSRYQLAQDLVLPGGTVLFVRVRAHGASYAISVTTDTYIDKFRLLPFQQFGLKLHVKSIGVLIGEDKPLWIGVTLSTLTASVSQGRPPNGDQDEFSVDMTIGELQVDDYRPQSKQKVVLQSVIGKNSTLNLVRLRDRTNPMIHLGKFVVVLRPIQIHIEDSFLFEVIKLGEKFKEALGASTEGQSLCVFENAPWVTELQIKPSAQDSYQWRMTFIEQLLIEQFVVSISLYRGTDKKKDPIREQLGVVSMLIRSVQDARFEWRRIEHPNLYDQLWILATFIRNYYQLELEQQVLNVVHVAGLDTMRGFVTDLLEGYFSSTAGHIDRTAPLVQRRIEAPQAPEDNLEQLGQQHSVDWETPDSGMLRESKILSGDAAKRNKDVTKKALTIEEYAQRTTWLEFVEGVSPSEMREHGYLALQQELRTRSMTYAPPPSLCKRCSEIEQIRQERWESDHMSVLPHPTLGEIDWCELAHHTTWHEFVAMCTPQEVRRFAPIVRDCVLGAPYSVERIDALMLSMLEDREDEQ